jgi:hypothetical protein
LRRHTPNARSVSPSGAYGRETTTPAGKM